MWGRGANTGGNTSQSQNSTVFSGGGGRGYQGGGRDNSRGQSFRGGRSRGRGRGGRYDSSLGGGGGGRGDASTNMQEPPFYDLCKFYVRDGSCKFGESCRNSHAIVTLIALKAHDSAVKCLGVVEASDSPRILSGSADSTIKVCFCCYLLWN